MRRTGGTRQLDDIDRRLCTLLAADPRTSNRSLAAAVGLTDETVALRLRRLRDDAVLATTVVVDWKAAGYQLQAMLRIRVHRLPFREVIAPVAHHASVLAVTETSGCCDGVITVLAQDLCELQRFVAEVVRPLPGVSEVTTDLVADDLKTASAIVTLPIPPWNPSELPAPVTLLDEVDEQLLRELTLDGHESYSEIARRLDVSDATIRRRVQRLEDGGLIKLVAALDPVATGDVTSVAFAFVDVVGPTSALSAAVADREHVLSGYSTIGGSGAILLLGSAGEGELTRFVSTDLPGFPGIAAFSLAYANEVLHHRSHLVSLPRCADGRS